MLVLGIYLTFFKSKCFFKSAFLLVFLVTIIIIIIIIIIVVVIITITSSAVLIIILTVIKIFILSITISVNIFTSAEFLVIPACFFSTRADVLFSLLWSSLIVYFVP